MMKTIRYFIVIICFLFLGLILAAAQSTNAPAPTPLLVTPPIPFLHGLAGLYGMLVIAAGWAAHVNWDKILAAYEWVSGQGGFWGILRKLAIGKPATVILFFALAGSAMGQTNETQVDRIFRDIGSPTNYAIEPYFTYAPKAPSKYGGGLLGIWNVSEHVGLGAGVDWLGHLSLLSVDATLQAPFHPARDQFPDLIVCPFLLGGIATAYGGAGPFNGGVSTVQDVGGFIRFGRLVDGQFNAGIAWGQWTGVGPYDVKRYHVFAGYSHGF